MTDEKSGRSECGDPANAELPLTLKEISGIKDRQERARELWKYFGRLMMGLAKANQASRNREPPR